MLPTTDLTKLILDLMGGPMKKTNLTLYIGDTNLSSWSLRPWLTLKHSGLDFSGVLIKLDTKSTAASLKKISPSGRVPVLVHDKTKIWDSLSICEYVAELAPKANLWPTPPAHRAIARSLVCEMHSGFQSLRSQLSMDIQLRMKIKHLTPATISDIQRICHIWDHSIRTNKGPYLFGKKFGITDAFYAPVVFRFQSYGIQIENKNVRKYMKSILDNQAVKEWTVRAMKEQATVVAFR